jgi:hypothetical protein
MRWVWYAAGMGEMRNSYKSLIKNLNGRHNLEDVSVDGRKILKWI